MWIRADINTIVRRNTISESTFYGFYNRARSSPGNVAVYNNNFINNNFPPLPYSSKQAGYSGGVAETYNQPLPVGGNYWSDWTSPDADNDGIVDLPYELGEFPGKFDYLPWVRPNGWVSNLPPAADAGMDQTIHLSLPATLDGSGSTDPDGHDPLTFLWEIVERPAGSSAVLSDPSVVAPTFTPDVEGDYLVSLVVKDSLGLASTPDTVVVTASNSPPIAVTGTGQTVHPGDPVTLDGSASTDPDGDYPLTYAWSFASKPAGSVAALNDPTAVNPTFTPDVLGNYLIQLTVTDKLGKSSEASQVQVSTFNTAPFADAGPDQAATLIGTVIHLDGTQSYDDDGDDFTYSWAFTQRPVGSGAALNDPDSPTPSFTLDLYGDYTLSLQVFDAFGEPSNVDTVKISFTNVKPIAFTGVYEPVDAGGQVLLQGSGSDANGDQLSFNWSIVSKPEGSMAGLANPLTPNPTLATDLPGEYVLSLVVSDGFLDSDPANVTILAVVNQGTLVTKMTALIQEVGTLDQAVFKNKNLKKALVNKLNAVLKMIDQGLYQDAKDKLTNDILHKMDGCDRESVPDKNDWLRTCLSQGALHPLVMEVILLLEYFI